MTVKILIGTIILLAAFIGGYITGQREEQVVYRTKIKEVVGETQTVWRDRIIVVTKTVKPDGTVVEKTTTAEKNKQQEKKYEQVAATHGKETTASTGEIDQYSLAASWALSRYHPPTRQDYQVTGGLRLIGPAWIEAGYRQATGEFLLGMRLEF